MGTSGTGSKKEGWKSGGGGPMNDAVGSDADAGAGLGSSKECKNSWASSVSSSGSWPA